VTARIAVLAVVCACSVAVPAIASGLRLPLRIDLRVSLTTQYGYTPAYERNVPSFDPSNLPFIRSRTVAQHPTDHVHTVADGAWLQLALVDAVRRDYPTFVATVHAGGYVSETVEFDRQGRAYTLLDIRLSDGSRENVLLYSLDGCRTWRTVSLPFGGRRTFFDGRDGGTATLEHFTGWNFNDGPPLVAVWRPVEDWPGEFASRNKLYVLRPAWDGDHLTLPVPKLVTSRALSFMQCAGGASFAATSGDRSFIAWAEVVSPGAKSSPTYVAEFDPVDGNLSPRVLVGRALPANDAHDTPGICLDGAGRLHVVTGAHGRPFFHARSLHPLDASAWTAPKAVLTSGYVDAVTDRDGAGKQTYLSLVCLPNDTLVTVYRQTRAGVDDVFGGKRYMPLCVQRRPPGGSWSQPKRLVFTRQWRDYAMYYHKLAVDRRGRLFLSLSYFDPSDYPLAKRAEHRYHHRMVLLSVDGGITWRFASKRDYLESAVAPV
jgi:hypothetical protein